MIGRKLKFDRKWKKYGNKLYYSRFKLLSLTLHTYRFFLYISQVFITINNTYISSGVDKGANISHSSEYLFLQLVVLGKIEKQIVLHRLVN